MEKDPMKRAVRVEDVPRQRARRARKDESSSSSEDASEWESSDVPSTDEDATSASDASAEKRRQKRRAPPSPSSSSSGETGEDSSSSGGSTSSAESAPARRMTRRVVPPVVIRRPSQQQAARSVASGGTTSLPHGSAAMSMAMSMTKPSSLVKMNDKSPVPMQAPSAADPPSIMAKGKQSSVSVLSSVSAEGPNPLIGTYFENKRFEITKQLGKGAFGEIYECYDHYRKRTAAAKMELSKQEKPQLMIECDRYECLTEKKCEGVPKLHWFSANVMVGGKERNVLIMEKLGVSLEDVMQSRPSKRLELSEVMHIVAAALRVLKAVHDVGIVHRDVKPENFLLAPDNNVLGPLYLVDFGLSKKIIQKGVHVPFRQGKDMTGTPRYASIHNHLGFEQSRPDDLMSLLFMAVYLAKGSLPWQGKQIADARARFNSIKEDKIEMMQNGSLFKGLPDAFAQFSKMIAALSFKETPDYASAIQLFERYGKRS